MAVGGHHVQLQCPAAASNVAHRLPERILKDPWVERTVLRSRRQAAVAESAA